jgi:hypothetical protein
MTTNTILRAIGAYRWRSMLTVLGMYLVLSTSIAASAHAAFDITKFDGGAFLSNGDPATQAGSHPATASTDFRLSTEIRSTGLGPQEWSTETLKDVIVDLPPGLLGNVRAFPTCSVADMNGRSGPSNPGQVPTCPLESQVGVVKLWKNGPFGAPGDPMAVYQPLYNVEAPHGTAALLGFTFPPVPVYISIKLRSDGDYGVTASALNAGTLIPLAGAVVEVWGVPADHSHDAQRGWGLGPDSPLHGCITPADQFLSGALCPSPDADNPKAFFTLPTSCVGPVETFIEVGTWEGGVDRSSFISHDNATPVPNPIGNDGCGDVPFTPSVSVAPTSTVPDSAAGVDAEISVPSDGLEDPEGVSQSHLKRTVVTLPEGMAVNPSGATGLAGCSDAQLGLGTDVEPSCPDGSKIGTVDVESPLIAEHLTGEVVLRTPRSTDPMSGEMLRLAIVARSVERGLLVKLPGSATADQVTGQLVATFDDNPQLPFSNLKVKFTGGPRGMLAMPRSCGEFSTGSVLSPWSGNAPDLSATAFDVAGDCSFGFAPRLAAGMSTPTARGSGDFSFKFSREDGEQWVDGLTANLPKGLLASVRDVTLCSSADAAAGSCPAGSRVGTVDATAGSGTPFVLERKGDAYLTEGYKGCPYGLAVKVPVVAGPFDASSPETDLGNIVVRQKVCVDPTTAEVSAISDPFPTIWHGIPLRVRSVTVKVDRAGFMLNPSDCSAKQITAKLHSAQGNTAAVSSPFQAAGCANLPYKPKLALSLTGKRQVTTGKHPGVKATVTQQGISEAGIEQAVVRLPKSIALDPENAQALCEFEDGTKPDLENRCPAGSIVGRARAQTPLLKNDLVGNVYFVKNVRKDPTTGNLIRTLPMIVVALRGEIAVNLTGESSTTKSGKLVNTFAGIPDAPIGQFNLNINGGPNGILAVTRTRKAKINICASRQIAEADTDGQNGRRHDLDIRIKTPCTRKQTKAAKLRAKRAAAKARR